MPQQVLAVFRAQVEGDGALVGVVEEPPEALLRVRVIVGEGATQAAWRAARGLYLDNVGAQIGRASCRERV